MKIVQVVPQSDLDSPLKSLLKKTELELRGSASTFVRSKEGRWKHRKLGGWINWDGGVGGILVAEIHSRKEGTETEVLIAFIEYLYRHLEDSIESIAIHNR